MIICRQVPTCMQRVDRFECSWHKNARRLYRVTHLQHLNRELDVHGTTQAAF